MLHTLIDLFGTALFFACYTYALGCEAASGGGGGDGRPMRDFLPFEMLVAGAFMPPLRRRSPFHMAP